MSKHLANVSISFEYFRDVFHFPEDTNIIAITVDNDHYGEIKITIENPELPEIQEGELIPNARPIYHRYFGENGEVIKIERESWGIL